MGADLRYATPSRGPFIAPRGACTVWTANGETLVAECKSPHLTPAGNAANAQLLALGASAVEHLRVALQQLADLGADNEEARAIVAKVDAIGKPQPQRVTA
jgi:hypothetical protein